MRHYGAFPLENLCPTPPLPVQSPTTTAYVLYEQWLGTMPPAPCTRHLYEVK